MSFSPDGCYLASSGKDRRLCLWQRAAVDDGKAPSFSLASAVDSAHKRIVWSVHFCPLEPDVLASGSRDGCIKIWRAAEKDEQVSLQEMHSFEPLYRRGKKAESVNALAFAPAATSDGLAVLAVGLECGIIELWGVPIASEESSACKLIHRVLETASHIATVNKLAWRPIRSNSDEDNKTLILASGSSDHGCRLYEVGIE
jgi:elongator complex protein 2